MNKYKKLFSNTVLFGIGSFSSKLLVLLMTPLYAHLLPKEDYGVVNLIVNISNFMLPLVTVGILNAIIRFGLDRSVDKSDVFTTGLGVIGLGFGVFLLLEPLLSHIRYFSGHTALIYLYVLMSCLRSLCSQFVRAQERVKLYALDGVLSTSTVILFNLLFLVVLRWGIAGYVLATIASDCCSALFLFVVARLWRFIRVRRGMKSTAGEMLRYSIPLIPTTICWWITNVSSQYIIAYQLGEDANGLYAMAGKIPNLVVIVSNIFIDAWQMSAVTDSKEGRSEFFTQVFSAFQSLVFLAASCIILFDRVVTALLTGGAASYESTWRYVPILVMATTFSCMVTFLGSVYMVEKRSVMNMVTTMTGAVLNVTLCLLLLPVLGINGAAVAMFVSYFVVFLLRAVSAQRMVHMHWSIPKLAFNLLAIGAQSVIMIGEVPYWAAWELMLAAAMLAVNAWPILTSVRKIFFEK